MHNPLTALRQSLDGALIASDFDGTLSPLVRDPSQARPVPGVIDSLIALTDRGARIAIVTGRAAETVLELGGLAAIPGVVVSGLHGIETWHDGQLETQDEPPALAELRSEIPPLLPPGVWLEDKRLSLVVHTRQADDPDRVLAELTEVIPPLVQAHGLEAHPGKQVIEIRIPGISKATALTALLTGHTTAALFAGDDLGDLPAVAAVSDWAARTGRPGVTIAVGESAELRAVTGLQLDDPAEMAALLAGLLD